MDFPKPEARIDGSVRERDRRARQHLAKRHARELQCWADARQKIWAIDGSWTVAQLLVQLEEHRNKRPWGELEDASGELRFIDSCLRRAVWCWCEASHAAESSVCDAHTIDELWNAMKAELPGLTRQRLRNLLARLSHKDVVRRLERGVYWRPSWWQWGELAERREDAPACDSSYERYERRLLACSTTLFVHYLLPHLRAYRKARALDVGERAYYYRLGEAIEHLEGLISSWRHIRRALAARANPVQS